MNNIKNISDYSILIGFLFFVCIFRYFSLIFLDSGVHNDSLNYILMAQNMAETGYMLDYQGRVAFFSPGYPLMMSIIFFIFGDNIEYIYHYNLILFLCSLYIVYLCAKLFLPNKWALLPVVIFGLYPPSIIYSTYILKETQMTFFMILQIFLLLTLVKQYRHYSCFIIGAIFGMQLLTGASMGFTGLVVIFSLWVASHNNARLKTFGLFAFGLFLVIGPWLTYTHHHVGKAVLSSSAGYNLFVGNNPDADGLYTDHNATHHETIKEIREEHPDSYEIKIDQYFKEKAKDFIKEAPMITFERAIHKFFTFWNLPTHNGNNDNLSDTEKFARLIWAFSYGILITFAAVSFFYRKSIPKQYYILAAYAGTYCISFIIFFFIPRFKLPLIPVFSLLASYSIYMLYMRYCLYKERYF